MKFYSWVLAIFCIPVLALAEGDFCSEQNDLPYEVCQELPKESLVLKASDVDSILGLEGSWQAGADTLASVVVSQHAGHEDVWLALVFSFG